LKPPVPNRFYCNQAQSALFRSKTRKYSLKKKWKNVMPVTVFQGHLCHGKNTSIHHDLK
jgi:hypothetical protein